MLGSWVCGKINFRKLCNQSIVFGCVLLFEPTVNMKMLAYIAQKNDMQFVVYDGKPEKEYNEIKA